MNGEQLIFATFLFWLGTAMLALIGTIFGLSFSEAFLGLIAFYIIMFVCVFCAAGCMLIYDKLGD